MFHEYETKILDINVAEIEEKLKKLGAAIIEKETLMRRRVFDIESSNDDGTGKRFRLRKKGDKTILTYKERGGNDVGHTKEREVGIADFDVMAEILQKLERKTTVYQETKRKVYSRNDIEFCIDSWPKIPTYLEIEGKDEEAVHEGLVALGLDGKEVGDIWASEVYKKYGLDLHSFKELKFEE